MKFEESILFKKEQLGNPKTYASIDNKQEGALCLYDPLTQLCKRIEAFFRKDPDIHCKFVVNNNVPLGPKIDPDTGEQMTKMMEIEGEMVEVYLEEDHICEFRVYCDDLEKAQCLSNIIRHRHVFPETFQGAYEDDHIHLRNHYLMVRVFTVDAVDPAGPGGGSNPWITDDNTDSGVQEIFGLEPISWNETEGYGCYERLAPSDTSESDIPKGFPEEYEQRQWEQGIPGPAAAAWKWKWIKGALKGNKNIADMSFEFNDGMNTWRFIECGYLPVVFQEDNLTSARGFNSILPADLLPTVCSIFGGFQISTYARRES